MNINRQGIQDIFDNFRIFRDMIEFHNNKWKRWSDEEEKKLIKFYENNYSYIEIAQYLNRSLSSTSGRIEWLCQQGIIQKRTKINHD